MQEYLLMKYLIYHNIELFTIFKRNITIWKNRKTSRYRTVIPF